MLECHALFLERVVADQDAVRLREPQLIIRRLPTALGDVYADRDLRQRSNLALDPDKHRELLDAMNAKRNALIEREVGEDVGQMLPANVDGGWVGTDTVYDV